MRPLCRLTPEQVGTPERLKTGIIFQIRKHKDGKTCCAKVTLLVVLITQMTETEVQQKVIV